MNTNQESLTFFLCFCHLQFLHYKFGRESSGFIRQTSTAGIMEVLLREKCFDLSTLNMTSEREVKGEKLLPLTSCWRGWMCLLDCCTADCCWFPYGWWTKTPPWPAGRGNTNVSMLLLFTWHCMHPLVLSLSVGVSWVFHAQTTYMGIYVQDSVPDKSFSHCVSLDVRC